MKFLLILLFSSSISLAASLPRALDQSARIEALKVLGFGTAASALSNPSHMGGYSGVEFYISNQIIPLDSVQKLGDRSGTDSSQSLTTFGVGKGLYLDIDSYIFFSPLSGRSKTFNNGFLLRRKIHEEKNQPLQVSAQLHASMTNFNNLVGTTTTGMDLVATYFGSSLAGSVILGMTRSVGVFTGGSFGITSTGETVNEDLLKSHFAVSGCYRINQVSLSLIYDYYFEGTYGARIAWRY